MRRSRSPLPRALATKWRRSGEPCTCTHRTATGTATSRRRCCASSARPKRARPEPRGTGPPSPSCYPCATRDQRGPAGRDGHRRTRTARAGTGTCHSPQGDGAGRVSRVSQRTVLVTGGSRGIGAAIARAFAACGDLVAVHYRQAAAAATAVRDALPGDGHVVVRADLTDADAVRAMVNDAAAGLGGLDVLVNNAGIYLEHTVTGTSYQKWQDAWRATLDVNLVGAANVTWCAVRHMVARGGGRIVNVGSRGAFRGEPAHPAYGASKAGLHAFGQSLAVALAPHGIAVASVAPGYVATDMTEEALATPAGDLIRAQSPFNRVGLPAEVAAAVVYLASPEASWASGAVLDLNGASYLRLAGTVFVEDP